MEPSEDALTETYKKMSNYELTTLVASGNITDIAKIVAVKELKNRGVDTVPYEDYGTKNNHEYRENKTTNKWYQVLFLFVACCIVLFFFARPNRISFVLIGEMFGVALAILSQGLLFSLIPSGIYRYLKGEWPRWQIWIAVPFMIIFFVLMVIGIQN